MSEPAAINLEGHKSVSNHPLSGQVSWPSERNETSDERGFTWGLDFAPRARKISNLIRHGNEQASHCQGCPTCAARSQRGRRAVVRTPAWLICINGYSGSRIMILRPYVVLGITEVGIKVLSSCQAIQLCSAVEQFNMLSTNDSSARRPGWSATSWRSMPVHAQQAVYEDDQLLEDVLSRLAGLPPLVNPDDVEAARAHYAAAARGEAFLLVGGDCAESFDDTKDHIIGQKMNLLANQARHIESTTGVTVHITARLAGQYSKPRSQLMETLPDGRQVHAFRGHNINGAAESDRKPDPKKLLHGWWHSLAVLHKLKSSR